MSILHQIKETCLDFLFPKHCVNCKKSGDFLCKDCLDEIRTNTVQRCPGCGIENEIGEVCNDCGDKYEFKSLLVAASYSENEFLRQAILAYKYKFLKYTAQFFGKMMAEKIREANYSNYVLVPVPLHWRRQFWRGFNQSEELAKVIAKENSVPIENILKRIKNTTPQASLKNLKQRHKNVKDAFVCTKEKLENKRYILIDDVCGTGATLSECALALQKSGAEKISAAVLARS